MLFRSDDYAAARGALGPSRIVGVACGISRHAAIDAAEAGADYVSFTDSAGLVQWWSETMTVPCVAAGDVTLENCATLVAAGADFLEVGAAVWTHPDSAAAAVRAFTDKIAANAPR